MGARRPKTKGKGRRRREAPARELRRESETKSCLSKNGCDRILAGTSTCVQRNMYCSKMTRTYARSDQLVSVAPNYTSKYLQVTKTEAQNQYCESGQQNKAAKKNEKCKFTDVSIRHGLSQRGLYARVGMQGQGKEKAPVRPLRVQACHRAAKRHWL